MKSKCSDLIFILGQKSHYRRTITPTKQDRVRAPLAEPAEPAGPENPDGLCHQNLPLLQDSFLEREWCSSVTKKEIPLLFVSQTSIRTFQCPFTQVIVGLRPLTTTVLWSSSHWTTPKMTGVIQH